MQTLMAAAVALATALSGLVVSNPETCHGGATAPMTAAGFGLELSASAWGGYCEGSSSWWMADASDGLLLEYGGGDPYSNVHFYRNLVAPSNAGVFDFSVDFLVPDTTFNNVGGASTVQAIEFSASLWKSERRYEWALQWTNVGLAEPAFRVWHPTDGWVDTGVTGTLAPGWHTVRFLGQVTSSGAKLKRFVVDGSVTKLNTTFPWSAAPGVPDLAAVAVQLDGNWEGAPYSIKIRDVDLIIR